MENRERDGFGTHVWKQDGSVYSGMYKAGKFHGKGKYYWSPKEWYSGEFKENARHGFGTYKYSCGVKYSGNWVNDMKQGEGEMKH